MIRYVLQLTNNIFDRERQCYIPICNDNNDYNEYLTWLTLGNTPVPAPPNEFYDLIGDEWVYNSDAQTISTLNNTIKELESKLTELFGFVYTLFDILKTKGLIDNLDVPQEQRQQAAEWKVLLDQIELYNT